MSRIAIHRPGAIGDVLMIMNCLPNLRKQFDEIDFFCHESIADVLHNFCVTNGLVDKMGSMAFYQESRYDRVVNCVGYPLREGYPDVKMRKHLISFFSDELGVEDSFDSISLPPCAIPDKITKTPYITIQNKTGWSVYKEWWGWQTLIDKLKCEIPDIGIYQIGGPNDPRLANIDDSFLGDSFDDNLAAQAWAKTHVGLDSVFNHTSNYQWRDSGKKNCVILWGSTQYNASGYRHNTNISLNLPCQPCFRENPDISQMSKGVCPNPLDQSYQNPKHECMAGIKVDMVYDAVVNLL
jgi:hypothetical protein